MIDIVGRVRWVRDRVNALFGLAAATLQLQETGGTITTTGAEQDVYRVETPLGVFEPNVVQIDCTANTAAETIRVRVYYRISSAVGAALIKKDEMVFAGAQDPALKNIELEPNRFGVQVTLQRLAGAALNYPWCALFRS